MLVYVKAYGQEIEIPTTVICGELSYMQTYAKMIEAILVDPQKILTVETEEALDAFKEYYAVFFCNKFEPSMGFVYQHLPLGWKFLNGNVASGIVPTPLLLAEVTGITAFRGLQWDATNNLWINVGKVTPKIQHSGKELAKRFANESLKWVAAGSPFRNQSTIIALFDNFCSKCSEYIAKHKEHDAGKCNLCGCSISQKVAMLNKLAWGTTNCPMDPPKWTAEIAVNDESIKNREVELFNEYLKIQKKEYGSQDAKICDCS